MPLTTAAGTVVRGPDPVLGKSVMAGGSHAGHPAANITGGRRLSYREGPAGASPQSVRVDPGGSVEADQVALKPPTTWEARTQTLAVEGSTDGSSVTSLFPSAPIGSIPTASAPSPWTSRPGTCATSVSG